LIAHTVKIWPGGRLDIPMIPMSRPLQNALRKAKLKNQLCYGFEAILEKVENEARGISHSRGTHVADYRDRVSRLLLFSSDGAERFYRHIEQLIEDYAPRLLGCLLDIDGNALGQAITGQSRRIKLVMTTHKTAVSEMLRTIASTGPTTDLKQQSDITGDYS
jgi:hypothetical protein